MPAQIGDCSSNIFTRPLASVAFEGADKLPGLLDSGGDFAMMQVGSQHHKALLGQPIAEALEEVVQTPPRMQHDNTWPRALRGQRQIARYSTIAYRKFDHMSSF